MAGPTLTAHTDGNPWVEVVFNLVDLDPSTVTLTMYRYSDNRTWKVRGGVRVAPGVAAQDFEAPFGVVSAYRAEQFDVNGDSLGFTDVSTITLNHTGTVVHQPLQPGQLWAPVRILAGTAAEVVRPTLGELVDLENGTVGRWIGSGRVGVRGVPVSLLAESQSVADRMQSMLGDYTTRQVGVLCIRTSDGVRWPRTFFARGDLSEVELTVKHGGGLVQFNSSMDEVEPPFPGLVRPLLTYADIDAAFTTYSAQDTEFGTYSAKDRAYEYAGYADGGE